METAPRGIRDTPMCIVAQDLAAGWVPEGGQTGIFSGRFLLVFTPPQARGIPLDRRGPPSTAIGTKNQRRRPILRPYRSALM